MKLDARLVPRIREYIADRKNLADRSGTTGAIRVDLSHVEHLNFRGAAKEGGSFTVEIDEPPVRGGQGSGPTPLNYFLMGAGSCLLMQWAKIAAIEALNIDDLEATVRGHTDRRIDGYFTDFVFDIRLTGRETEERIRQVSQESERLCFVHNTLKRAVPVVTNINYNGKLLFTSKAGPESMAATAGV